MNIDLGSHGIVAVLRRGDKYLLIKEARDLLNGHWAPPHGRMNPEDQDEETAVIRESMEEIGIKVVPVKKIITVPADTKTKTISFWLVESVGDKEMVFDKTEISESGWFTVDEALGLLLYPATKNFFTDIKEGTIAF
jgi:8-oxo-dGTP pyrophosphatase MutT (NUDIX family)